VLYSAFNILNPGKGCVSVPGLRRNSITRVLMV
jgi:hypothetical protein